MDDLHIGITDIIKKARMDNIEMDKYRQKMDNNRKRKKWMISRYQKMHRK